MANQGNSSSGFMHRLASFIVDRRKFIIVLFILASLFCAFSRSWVKVNDNITDYLPPTTETRIGLTIMDENFTTYGTAEVMVDNISYPQAEALLQQISNIYGVKSVSFDDTEAHYNQSAALYSVTFDGLQDDAISIQALAEINSLLENYDLYVNSEVGNPLKAIIDSEMLVVDIIAVVIIILVLLVTSRTYAEIPVLLITFGAAALLNMGTNFLMGEISFVTNSIAIVLQLALAIDYAIILCHRFMDERLTYEAREAAIEALTKAIPEISASSLTTVSGLLALSFMQFRLGFDMGIVLIKAIMLSLCSVFLLMPGLLVLFSKLIDRTHHKSFVPRISFLGKMAYKTRYVVPVLFAIVLVGAYFCSHNVNYVYSQYSVSSIRKNTAQIAKERIDDTFYSTTQLAIVFPTGDYSKEARMIEDIQELPATDSVLGLADIEAMDGYYLTSEITPRQFSELTGVDYEVAALLYAAYAVDDQAYGQIVTNLENYKISLIDIFDYVCEKRYSISINMSEDDEATINDLESKLNDAKAQLMNKDWSRIVVNTTLPLESPESFAYLNILHGIAARYYDTCYVVGDTTSCSDLRSSFEKDNVLINVLTIAFVIIVLIVSFRSLGLPVLLILIIQGSILCNFSVPFLRGKNLFFLTYLIISAIQMGANIDYAIVISSRYMTLKTQLPLKDAMTESLNEAFPTIITSGAMLALAGVSIGVLTSNETISSIGVYLGEGTFISIFLVMCVMPQILLFGDSIINKTSFDLKLGRSIQQRQGLTRIDGRVIGTIDGFVDAEIHGFVRGSVNGVIEVGKKTPNDLSLLPDENLNTDSN
ncbi:MAG: MMPL family transporter [Oscillospiraceae bacterium]|nr:MMPL family transporter [Oscillospiraceae bacterium]